MGCRDPKDDFLLELAAVSSADFLVTGDRDLLELRGIGECRIISPSDFDLLLRGMDAPGIFHDIDCSDFTENPFPSQNADSDWLRTSGCQGQNIAEYKNKSYNERLQNIRGRDRLRRAQHATLLSQHHHVTAVDVIPEKVEMINSRRSPIQDEYIERYLAENPST